MAATQFFPTSLSQTQTSGSTITVYPSDLFSSTGTPAPAQVGGNSTTVANAATMQTTANGTNVAFYTQIQMVPANTILTGITGTIQSGVQTNYANPQQGSSIYLPLPWKINDIEMHVWNDLSFTDQIPIINELAKLFNAAARGGLVPGVSTTQSVNPFLYMIYKQPAFREFEFAWSFSPNNAQESQTLAQIINYLKTGALPTFSGVAGNIALTLGYPFLALIRLAPSQYMFDLKPCAITSVNIDYSGSGHGPAFFNDGSPAIINFTLGLKEIAIQTRDDTKWRAGTLAQTAGF